MQSACAWLHAIKPELRGKLDAGTFVAAAATAALTISLYFLFKPAIVPRLFIIICILTGVFYLRESLLI